MSKNLKLSVLLDFYGDMLTDKQRDVIELYYNEDLSLAEIAQHENISRQGVRDSIKRGEEIILELEDKLKLYEKFSKLSTMLDKIKTNATQIYEESYKYKYSHVITDNAKEIIDCLKENEDVI